LIEQWGAERLPIFIGH